jgi:hypothetical protein
MESLEVHLPTLDKALSGLGFSLPHRLKVEG